MSYDCYCDYDTPEVYSRFVRQARKEHRCTECGSRVSVGEKYEYVFAVQDGDPFTARTCSACVDLRQWTRNNVPCLCWAHGNTIEDCTAAIDDARRRAPEETRGLRFGFLRRLHAIKRRAA